MPLVADVLRQTDFVGLFLAQLIHGVALIAHEGVEVAVAAAAAAGARRSLLEFFNFCIQLVFADLNVYLCEELRDNRIDNESLVFRFPDLLLRLAIPEPGARNGSIELCFLDRLTIDAGDDLARVCVGGCRVGGGEECGECEAGEEQGLSDRGMFLHNMAFRIGMDFGGRGWWWLCRGRGGRCRVGHRFRA